MHDKIAIKGHVYREFYDSRYIQTYKDVLIARNRGLLDKVTIYKDEGDNRVVDVGVQQIIDLIIGSNVLYPAYCQNGSGTNTVTSADVDLQTPITPRQAMSYRYRSGLSVKIDTFFDKNTENGTWAESSIWTAITSGIMFARKLFDASFSKTTSNTSTVTWVWTFTPSG